MDNVQKLPFGRSFQEGARRKVLEHIQLMSGRAPATLVKATDKTNTIWMVKFDTDSTFTLPQVKVPVHGSEFQRIPYQPDAKGFVTTADMTLAGMTGLGSTTAPASFTRGGNLADLLWHPVGNTNFKPVIDPNAHETYGADGGTITHDGTAKSIVKTHKDKGTSASSGGDGSGAPGPHEMATSTSGTSIKTPMPHTLDAKNATLNAGGDQTNEGSHTSKSDITSSNGSITAAEGNVSAPNGSVSGMSGSFGSGILGGLKLLGGILSGGGGSSGSPSLMISSDEVSAATLRTNVVYTVAGLNAQLPPSAAMEGVRAYVSDAQANPTFLQVLAGGGTQGCPAVCVNGMGTDPNGNITTGFYWAAG